MRLMACVVIALCSIAAHGCQHALLTTEGIGAALRVAVPYLDGQCQELQVAPEYVVSWDGMERTVTHGGGLLIGGCGSLAELACRVVPDPAGGPSRVECEAIRGYQEVEP